MNLCAKKRQKTCSDLCLFRSEDSRKFNSKAMRTGDLRAGRGPRRSMRKSRHGCQRECKPLTALLHSPEFVALPRRKCALRLLLEGDDGANKAVALQFTGVESYKCTFLTFRTADMFNLAYAFRSIRKAAMSDDTVTPTAKSMPATLRSKCLMNFLMAGQVNFNICLRRQ